MKNIVRGVTLSFFRLKREFPFLLKKYNYYKIHMPHQIVHTCDLINHQPKS